jgi:hypothetical protein
MSQDESKPVGHDRPKVALELNLGAIIAPAQNAVVLASEIVDFVSAAMQGADLSEKPVNQELQYRFKSPDVSAAERRAMYESWLYSKAFQDLLRGLKGSLELAYVFVNLLSQCHRTASDTTIENFLAPFKKEAATLHFGPLLDKLNERFGEPLPFVEAYHSLQRARNCFEHRNGVVGNVDAPAGGVMILSFPRVKMFYKRGDEEVELEAGHVIDAGDGKEGVQIFTKIEPRERRFSPRHRLEIAPKDFNEIAFACNFFAEQLADRVSRLKPPQADESIQDVASFSA